MKDSDLSTTAARDAARIVWFKRYPAKQTLIAFLLALLATTAFSIDPAPVSSNAVLAIDPKASGMLYVCYEVLLSFAGHTDAVMLLALACLLTLPFRYVFFGRGDTWRPSIILPSLFFAICMVFGRSYDLTDSAEIVLGDKARIICAWIGGAGWMLLAIVAFYLAFECLDWLSSRRIPFSEAHFGRIWRVAHAVLSVHPFAGPFLVLMIAWAPTRRHPEMARLHPVREEAVAEVKQGEIQSVIAVGRAKQVSVVALASRRHVAHHRFVLDAVQPDERQSQRVDHGGRLHHFATVAFARPAHLSLRQIARIVAERRFWAAISSAVCSST